MTPTWSQDVQLGVALAQHRERLADVVERPREAALADRVPHDERMHPVTVEPFRDRRALVLGVVAVAAARKD